MKKTVQELKVEMATTVIIIDFLEKMLMLSPDRKTQEQRFEAIKAFNYLESQLSEIEE